jgi:Ca-activated chloride channel homolog
VPATGQFQAAVQQVEVYATVSDARGRAMTGLPATAFEVLEDGTAQEITTFVEGEFPAAVALLVDRSFSMAGAPLANARLAGRALLGALTARDRSALLAIGGGVDVLAPLGTDHAATAAALDRLDPWSTTALHDGLVRAIDTVAAAGGRGAVVVLSDGVDRYSSASADDVLAAVRRSGVLVYPVALGRTRPPFFAELAAASGGRSVQVQKPEALTATLTGIAEELRHQYRLGFQPRRAWPGGAGEWRGLEVRVHGAAGARVRARAGYRTGRLQGPAAFAAGQNRRSGVLADQGMPLPLSLAIASVKMATRLASWHHGRTVIHQR